MITVKRSALTELVIAAVASTGKAVGDNQMPVGQANWIGQPMTPGSVYQPFAVVSELNASRSWGGLTDPQSDWQMPYMVEYFGITRVQCEALAELARDKVSGIRAQSYLVGSATYSVMWVNLDQLGEPQRIDTFKPPVFHAQDGFTVWITKE